MNELLPRLRTDLDFIPSPVSDRPGLLLRDPFRYTPDLLFVPALLVRALALLDGEHSVDDLRSALSAAAGSVIPEEILASLIDTLRSCGFLETEEFFGMRDQSQAEFAAATVRVAAHSGSGYPGERDRLSAELDSYDTHLSPEISSAHPAGRRFSGIAAPHVSPHGGAICYSEAYLSLRQSLSPDAMPETIVILGTSHYGAPERFGLTRKTFTTPLGSLETDRELVDELNLCAPGAIVMEDYCHAIEHSIEFQCIFLQHALQTRFKILPILCGPFAEATLNGSAPEKNEQVHRFIDALTTISERCAGRLLWVLGVDMAHVGRRYGDRWIARAHTAEMLDIERQDRARLERVCAGDAQGFLEMTVENRDPLKWCGFSPIYTFLRAHNRLSGQVNRYDQWNIDDESVVSFAAMSFSIPS